MSKNKDNHAEKADEAVCGCGCGCDEIDDVVELVDEEGKAVKFNHVATIDFEGGWYVFFSPVENTDGVSPDEVVIFKLEDEEGKDVFAPIEDEELLQKVYDEYVRVMEEEDDEEEDDEEECGSGCAGCGGGCGGCGSH